MTARALITAVLILVVPASVALGQTSDIDRSSPPAFELVAQQQPPPGAPVVQPPPGAPVVQPPPGPPVEQPPPGGPRRPEQPNPPRPAAPPQPAVGGLVPPRSGQSFNIKVDVTISEQIGTAPAAKKTVSIVSGENMSGFVRSEATFGGGNNVPLNVDIEPSVLADGKIRLGLSVQYDMPAPPNVVTDSSGRPVESQTAVRSALGSLTRTQVRQNLKVVLENGKPLMISQSADPVGDRKVTIEVMATILK